ncbi:hypothetical protein Dda_1800 [Drechslerella dactyloides]|uniref:Midasin n=1 Tax=Drechslerella dactyloides TaxID=74499 RepID=A0AAD6J454_DREDA|nr:hypothetical protein Dda_1800 [Drechslerella dactyloides]
MWSTSLGERAILESGLLQSIPSELLLDLQSEDNRLYLDTLSRIALHPRLTSHVFISFEPIFPDLLSRWVNFATPQEFAAGLSIVLPVAPYLTPYAEYYLLGNGSKSFSSLHRPNGHPASQTFTGRFEDLSVESIQAVLVTLLRLLKFNFQLFSSLSRLEDIWALLKSPSTIVKYLCLQIASLYLKTADTAREELLVLHCGTEPILGSLDDQPIDFRFFWTQEARRLDILKSAVSSARIAISPQPATSGRNITPHDISPQVISVAGLQFLRLPESTEDPEGHVETVTAQKNLKELAIAIRIGDPILVQGRQGSGKTHYVHHAAKLLGASKTLISIHLGKQTDTKLLLGTYVSSEPPGTFKWKPGVLTTAVREGRWVLIEDLDQAPNEVLSLLIPLMQRRTLFIPNRAETIVAPSNFRLIATVRTVGNADNGVESLPPSLSTVGIRLWHRVTIKQPSLDEIVAFVNALYSSLVPFSSSLVQVYDSVRTLQSSPTRDKILRGPSLRQIGLRELLNWCARINGHTCRQPADSRSGVVSEYLLDLIFLEALDCFAGQYSEIAQRKAISNCIARGINLDLAREQYLLAGYVPTYHDDDMQLSIGRTKISKASQGKLGLYRKSQAQEMPFAMHQNALRLLERVSVCVNNAEPVLLVGETGTGKTTAVQYLAKKLNKKLTVHNFSQHTESGDLMGGFQPMDLSRIGLDLSTYFDSLFRRTFPSKRNLTFLDQFDQAVIKRQWKRVIRFWNSAIDMASKQLQISSEDDDDESGLTSPRKRRKLDEIDQKPIAAEWRSFSTSVSAFDAQFKSSPQQAVFTFVEGLLVKAVRNGEWVLLDEMNLASPETLESIADLMNDSGSRSMLLLEKGGVDRIYAHPDFRIFGCMNPATDVGKRDLPQGIRSRFTEFYVPNPDGERANVLAIVKAYLEAQCVGSEHLLSTVTDLYLEIRMRADKNYLVDGAGQKPVYSIRTLTRTLAYVVEIAPIYGILRSLYEGFCMAFLTCLASESENILHQLIEQKLFSNHTNARSLLKQVPKMPVQGDFTQFRHYWMLKGPAEVIEQPDYIITPYVERNLLNLVRASATRKYPVLIQGPTSSGKTSMIKFLANRTGHRFIRINNHEHTDLQEYLGSYVSDPSGSLKFQEGALIQAMRTGCWVILDELNLAPTDVLEALNRLLDDNREILIPETQEVVRPHKDFMLFATQNPPGLYAGRKVLSKAFRNRFIELHFDDIPQNELQDILQQRTQIAPSFAARIVSVYNELSILRQSSRLFEQKQSFATLRDLFRWANRDAVTSEELAHNGYMLLVERVRNKDEKLAVKRVIEAKLKVRISDDSLYSRKPPSFGELPVDVVWTKAMARLYTLLERAIAKNEPVLLVGETGCGKTTVCHLLALAYRRALETVNAHMNTETGDIIGAYRPLRNRSEVTQQLLQSLNNLFIDYVSAHYSPDADADLKEILRIYDSLQPEDLQKVPADLLEQIQRYRAQANQLFEWVDGSLVGAMKNGSLFLLDEISLAEDSVLERLNSVLEPEREIFLAEKGYKDAKITAHPDFQFFATMNPGGDYGKKELSPALRNRFTEIWVPPMDDFEDVLHITETKLTPAFRQYAPAMVKFGFWFNQAYKVGKDGSISIRDIISWINFCNRVDGTPLIVVFQGALLVYIDTLGSNPAALLSVPLDQVELERRNCVNHLSGLVGESCDLSSLETTSVRISPDFFQVGAFGISRKACDSEKIPFDFNASTTSLNAMRVMRAMQLEKPILLEGQPGVGKTSLITALAAVAGIPLVRINLSEETDMMDLFGSDVPAENGAVGTFVWREAPFLQAMQAGQWVLLDEMNLASQSVLEGLNSCLDHRKTVYVPELGRTFHCHPEFRLFAAQNPHHQGNGRKGLPASFVNRFTVVYIRSLQRDDLLTISQHTFPQFSDHHYSKVVEFSSLISQSLGTDNSFGVSGAPWEFNLRDTLRWLEITAKQTPLPARKGLQQYFKAIVSHRFRSGTDVAQVNAIFKKVFKSDLDLSSGFVRLSSTRLQVGNALISRNQVRNSHIAEGVEFLPHQLHILESILNGVNNRWPCLLVGLPGSGKSSMIELLAKAVGAYLEVIPLNNDTETTDVIGGYEQEDPFRLARATLHQLHADLEALIIESSLHNIDCPRDVLALSDLLNRWEPTYPAVEEVLRMAEVILHTLAWTPSDRRTKLQGYTRVLEMVLATKDRKNQVSFAWYDGALVRAVEEGHWVILDNANLCNPSVLDRINSLLETKGALFLHEHTSADGGGRVIMPHPNFRLFLTMDPRNGELSRAMRNRSIEIYVPSLLEECEDWGFQQSKTLNLIDHSSARTLARMDFLVRRAVEHHPEDLGTWIYHILEETPIAEFANILAWMKQNNPKEPASANVMRKATSLFQEVKNQAAGQLLLAFKNQTCSKLGLDARFLANESLHPLSNPYILDDADTTGLDSLESAKLLSDVFDVALSSSEVQVILADVLNSIKSQLLPQLVNNTSSDAYKSTGIDRSSRLVLLEFFSRLNHTIQLWLDHLNIRTIASQAPADFLWSIEEILLFIQFTFSVRGLDGLTFQACSDKIRGFLSVASRIWPDSTMQETILAFQDLVREHGLGSGFSWSRVWKSLRKELPQSEDGMLFLKKLKTIANKFDEVSQSLVRPTSQVLQLRLLFAKASEQIRSAGSTSEMPIIDFEEAVKLMEVPNDSPAHPFLEEFDLILRLRLLSRMSGRQRHLTIEDLNTLAYHSSWPTQHLHELLGFLASGENSVLGTLFRPVISNDALDLQHSLASKEFFGIFVKKIAHLSDIVHETSIGGYLTVRSDVQALCKQFGLAIGSFSVTYWEEFTRLLVEKIYTICRLHGNLFSDNAFLTSPQNPHSPELLLQYLSSHHHNVSDERWSAILEKYLIVSLRTLLDGETGDLKSRNQAHALAWIYFAIGCLKLFIPVHPYDPALEEQLNHQLFLYRERSLHASLQSLEMVMETLSGSRENERCRYFKRKINRISWDNRISMFQRSKQSDFEPLRQTLQRLVGLVNGQQLQKFIHDLSCPGVDTKAVGQNIRENIKQILHQIKIQDDSFEDLASIVEEFVLALEFGILISMSCETESQSKDGSEFIFTPEQISAVNLQRNLTKASPRAGRHELQSLQTLALRVNIEGICSFKNEEFALLDTAFSRVLRIWERAERETAREREEATQLYHFKGLEELNPDDDEAGVAEMFSDVSESEKRKQQRKGKIDIQGLSSTVSSLHKEIYLGSSRDSFDVASLQSDIGSQIKHASESLFVSSSDMEKLVPMMMLELSHANTWLNKPTKSSFNFYKDDNPNEVRKVTDVLTALKTKIADLVARWPENDILRDASEKIEELLKLPLKTPVNNVLAKLEGLHATLHQWEQVASKEFSVKDYQETITNLIVSWRRLELQTWPSLFSQEEVACRQNSTLWWFHIYKAVKTASEIEDQDIATIRIGLADTLNTFLRQSTMGEFETRLALLKAMQEQLKYSSSKHSEALTSTIHNILQLHSQFRKAVGEHTSAERVKLEKDMKEVILLASWKDTNVNALKESTRRSHYQLYKVVKKYRSVLTTPVYTIAKVADLSNLEMSTILAPEQNPPSVSTEDTAVCAAAVSGWDSRPARLVNISSTVSKMQQSQVSSTPSQSVFALVDQFSDHILQRAQELRDSTPSKLTKENTAEVRRIQDSKRKAVSEALKSLRQMGFKSNLSQKELAGQASAVDILGSTPAIAAESFQGRLGEINQLVVATLENLSKTRTVLSNIPADVPVPDLVRASKYFEHGLSIILQQREAIASHLKIFDRLHDVIGYFMVFCKEQDSGDKVPPTITNDGMQDPITIRQQLGWIHTNLNFALRAVDAEASFVLGDYGDLRTKLQQWEQWATKSLYLLRSCPETFSGVILPQQRELIAEVLQGFKLMKAELSQIAVANPELKHIISYLGPWIPANEDTSDEPKRSSLPPSGCDHISELDGDIQRLCDTILALVQPEAPENSTAKKASGPEKPVLVEHERMLASRVSVGCSAVVHHLESLGSKLRQTATKDVAPIRALMRVMAPIIIEYGNICQRDLIKRLDFHRSICRLTHILSNFVINIGTNGFCAPSDGSAEAGTAGQLESGTGLGDGEGEEDISNDIAPDEDLSELANQKEEEGSSKKDYDAQENAVENDDIDGMSDSGSEKSDKEEEEDEGEENDMAEEMGKVDDSHGLDSLDKDFWDNPEEEPNEEIDAGGEGKNEDDAKAQQNKPKKDEKQQADAKDASAEELEPDDDASEASAEDEADAVEKRENDNFNEHIPEVERLEISDDFNLDDVDQMEEDDNEMEISDNEGDDKDGLDENFVDADNRDVQPSDSEEDDEMVDQNADTVEETTNSPVEESEQDGEEQPEEALQESTDDPVNDVPDAPPVPQNAQLSAMTTSSGDADMNSADPITSHAETETDGQQEEAQESSVPNATDGQGSTGKAEYRHGHGQGDPQSKEQRLENSLKKLGDLLEKVLRTPMDILDSETSQGPKDEIQNPEEQKQSQFEHVGEDNQQTAAQALGAATTEEAQTIDESMVVDSAPNSSEQPAPTGDDDLVDDSAEGADGKESNERAGFQETLDEVEDTPTGAVSIPKDDPEAAMEVDVPRLMAKPKNDSTDLDNLDIDMDIDNDEQAASEAPAESTNHTSLTNNAHAQSLWTFYEDKTRILSLSLTEQLRLILEPTLSTKLRGDYRTGKRLNMKRIIPYIASDYKKDKIWMRRTKPSKRQYQVMIALDDSKSMSEPRCVELTLESIALVARALTHLEVGQIAMVSFGETTQLVHPFEQPFTAQAGANIFASLSFTQTKTNMRSLVESSIRLFREAKQTNQQSDLWQLELIISDGICEDHREVQRLVRLAHFEKVVLIFVIIDAAAGGAAAAGQDAEGIKSKGSSSILDMKEAVFTDQGDGKGPKLQVNRYMDTFPFSYYLIIRRIEDLPGMLSTALRQWFSQAAEASS